ncbi:MAG: formylglycine-generating enzyme family protein [Ignavibacteria bacterium]
MEERLESHLEQSQDGLKNTIPEGMVYVEGGEFMMGDENGETNEKPVHRVELRSFYIDKYEVTVGEFEEFINATGYKTNAEKDGWSVVWDNSGLRKKNEVDWRCGADGNPKNDNEKDHPAIYVSWDDALAYAKWIGKRLPTEAEWEYAARGGNKSEGYKYSGSNNIDTVGWYGRNSGNRTHKVGAKEPNELGLYDMSGNVWEWCDDWYDEDYYSKSEEKNPAGPKSGEYCVLRGGSWNDYDCRATSRSKLNPDYWYYFIGFRCVRDL